MASSLRPSWSTECDLVSKTTKLANSNPTQPYRSPGHSGLHQPCLSGLRVPTPCLAAYRSAAPRSQLWVGPRKPLSHRALAAIRPCATILGEPPVPGVECQGLRAQGRGGGLVRVTLGTQGTVTQAKESTETLSPLTLEQQVCKGTQSENVCAHARPSAAAPGWWTWGSILTPQSSHPWPLWTRSTGTTYPRHDHLTCLVSSDVYSHVYMRVHTEI